MLKLPSLLLLFTLLTFVASAQGYQNKMIRLLDGYETDVNDWSFHDNHLYVSGWNTDQDMQHHYFAAKLDTNLNVVSYRNVSEHVDSSIVGYGRGDHLCHLPNGDIAMLNALYREEEEYSVSIYDSLLQLKAYSRFDFGTDYAYPYKMLFVEGSLHILQRHRSLIDYDTIQIIHSLDTVYVPIYEVAGIHLHQVSMDLETMEYRSLVRYDDKIIDFVDYQVMDDCIYFSFLKDANTFKKHYTQVHRKYNLSLDSILVEGNTWLSIHKNFIDEGDFYIATAGGRDQDTETKHTFHVTARFDKDLKLEWYRDHLVPPFIQFEGSQNNSPRDLFKKENGNYLMVGAIGGHVGLDTFNNSQIEGYPFFDGVSLVEFDENSNELWATIDTANHMSAKVSAQLPSGNIIVFGHGYDKVDTLRNYLPAGIAMAKYGPDGCITPNCRQPTAVTEVQELEISIYPNPAIDKLHIQNNSGEAIDRTSILSNDGRMIYSSNMQEYEELDVSNFVPGLYYLQLQTVTGKVQVLQFQRL